MRNNDTPCKKCIFAEYEDDTQVGCLHNMVEKYKQVGSNVLEAYDHEKEFYVIEQRTCPFYREQWWKDRIDDFDNNYKKILKFETSLAFQVIVFIKESDSIQKVKNTLKSLLEQDKPPSHVAVVRPVKSLIRPKELRAWFIKKNPPFLWRIENLSRQVDDERVIHTVHKTVKCQYYVLANAGYKFNKSYLKNINTAVIDNLLQFAMIENENGGRNGLVIPYSVHDYWYFKGDPDKTIQQNIRDHQCQIKQDMILSPKQLVTTPTIPES